MVEHETGAKGVLLSEEPDHQNCCPVLDEDGNYNVWCKPYFTVIRNVPTPVIHRPVWCIGGTDKWQLNVFKAGSPGSLKASLQHGGQSLLLCESQLRELSERIAFLLGDDDKPVVLLEERLKKLIDAGWILQRSSNDKEYFFELPKLMSIFNYDFEDAVKTAEEEIENEQ